MCGFFLNQDIPFALLTVQKGWGELSPSVLISHAALEAVPPSYFKFSNCHVLQATFSNSTRCPVLRPPALWKVVHILKTFWVQIFLPIPKPPGGAAVTRAGCPTSLFLFIDFPPGHIWNNARVVLVRKQYYAFYCFASITWCQTMPIFFLFVWEKAVCVCECVWGILSFAAQHLRIRQMEVWVCLISTEFWWELFLLFNTTTWLNDGAGLDCKPDVIHS